jgi:hypothetical protein
MIIIAEPEKQVTYYTKICLECQLHGKRKTHWFFIFRTGWQNNRPAGSFHLPTVQRKVKVIPERVEKPGSLPTGEGNFAKIVKNSPPYVTFSTPSL